MVTRRHRRPWRDRLAGGVGALGLPAAVLVALWFAGGPVPSPAEPATITAIRFREPPPPPPEPPPEPPPPPKQVTQPAPKPLAEPEREGAAAPPNLRSRATPVVAPRPIVPRLPTAFAAAPVPAAGTDPTSGASDRAGPGTGAGGLGDGSGSGRGGDGGGGGGGGTVPAIEAVKIAGEIPTGRRLFRLLPAGVDTGRSQAVTVFFTVLPTGRVIGCTVSKSSGNRVLDGFTCDQIEQRFLFRPARDRFGRPVEDEQGWLQVYTFDGSEPVIPRR